MLEPNSIVGPYVVEKLLGKGGIAAVYKVRHRNLQSHHALKVLFTTDPDSKERLLREGRVQASLRHPNIVAVTDVMEVDKAPALVMEFVDGPSLFSWLGENRPSNEVALEIFKGIVLALQAAHESGVVHRDLKPENVLLAPTNHGLIAKVCDFGLVKVLSGKSDTMQGVGFGTPEYMAPEQIADAAGVDHRADLWALGCLLYEICTGQSAFEAPDVASIYDRVRNAEYDSPTKWNPDLDPRIIDCIGDLLQVDPEDRIQTAGDVFDRLYERAATGYLASNRMQRMVSTETNPPPVQSYESRDQPPPPTSPAVYAGVTVVVVLLAVGITAWIMSSSGDGTEPLIVPPPDRVVDGSGPEGDTPDATTDTDESPPTGDDTDEPPPEDRGTDTNDEPASNGTSEEASNNGGQADGTPDGPPPEPPVEPKRSVDATVSTIGDAKSVALVSDAGRIELPSDVPPGRYEIEADFGEGAAVPAGTVQVLAEEALTLKCSSFAFRCVPVVGGDG